MKNIFTSEAVGEGHPDKVADQIADRILDECLKLDKNSHVACEIFITDNYVLIGGEIKCNGTINYEEIARNTIKSIGYTKDEIGIDGNNCIIDIKVRKQSSEIDNAVTKKENDDVGAGDQGIVFGYATNELDNYMPYPITLATELVKEVDKARKLNLLPHARPDSKSQVSFDYSTNKIDTIILSVQHDETTNVEEFREELKDKVIYKVIDKFNLNKDCKLFINSSGSFSIGGPKGDTGLTGRKLVCDSYGGYARHGGGALSGKDATKIDRCAAYYARYMAKNLVAAGIADKIEIELSYAIGVKDAISVSFFTQGTSKYSDEVIENVINKVFDPSVKNIIKTFSLDEPNFKYKDTSIYGHFGRKDFNFPWEKLDKVSEIKALLF